MSFKENFLMNEKVGHNFMLLFFKYNCILNNIPGFGINSESSCNGRARLIVPAAWLAYP